MAERPLSGNGCAALETSCIGWLRKLMASRFHRLIMPMARVRSAISWVEKCGFRASHAASGACVSAEWSGQLRAGFSSLASFTGAVSGNSVMAPSAMATQAVMYQAGAIGLLVRPVSQATTN